MEFTIKLSELALLPDADGITGMRVEEQFRLLKRIFDYLPEGTHFDIRGDIVRIVIPELAVKERSAADRYTETAARKAKNGDYSKAKSLLKRALELDPTLAIARQNLAMICSETGEHEEAKDQLIDLLRLQPDNAWGYVILANHYAKHEDNPAMAEKLLKKALELSPQDTWALNSMAAVVMEQDRPEEATQLFESAIGNDRSFAHAYFGKTLIHVRGNDFEAAESTLEDLFRECRPQDQRAVAMFAEARKTYLRVENILANNYQAASAVVVDSLLERVEAESGFAIGVGPLYVAELQIFEQFFVAQIRLILRF